MTESALLFLTEGGIQLHLRTAAIASMRSLGVISGLLPFSFRFRHFIFSREWRQTALNRPTDCLERSPFTRLDQGGRVLL